MNIGEVLSRAWQIIMKHKALWLFGILASCGNGGGGGGGGSGGRTFEFDTETPFDIQPYLPGFLKEIPPTEMGIIIAAIILVIFVLLIFLIFLSTAGRIGLIHGAALADGGAEKLTVGELFSSSLPYFWRVFFLNLIVGLCIMLAVVILVVPLAISIVGIACLIPLICLFVPLSWLITIVVSQANVAIVVENLGMMEGLRRGWEVVRANIGNYFLMSLILLIGVAGIVGFVISIPILIFVIPVAIKMATGGVESTTLSQLLPTLLCIAGYLPILIVLDGILTSYIETAWTLTFMRITRPQVDNLAPPL